MEYGVSLSFILFFYCISYKLYLYKYCKLHYYANSNIQLNQYNINESNMAILLNIWHRSNEKDKIIWKSL